MLENGKHVVITAEERNALLQISSRFSLPEKIGDFTYTLAERSLADEQVRSLYAELKSRSPLLSGKERALAFGPREAWDVSGEKGTEIYNLKDPELEVKVTLKKSVLNGAVWCLFVMLHPQSGFSLRCGQQNDLAWPIARKIGRERMLREEIKLPEPELQKSRWDHMKSDEDYKEAVKEA